MKKAERRATAGIQPFSIEIFHREIDRRVRKEKNFIHYPVKRSETRMNIGVQRFSIEIFHGGN